MERSTLPTFQLARCCDNDNPSFALKQQYVLSLEILWLSMEHDVCAHLWGSLAFAQPWNWPCIEMQSIVSFDTNVLQDASQWDCHPLFVDSDTMCKCAESPRGSSMLVVLLPRGTSRWLMTLVNWPVQRCSMELARRRQLQSDSQLPPMRREVQRVSLSIGTARPKCSTSIVKSVSSFVNDAVRNR